MDCRLFCSNPIDVAISLPASKSISNRVLIIRSLSSEFFPIFNLSVCDDTKALIAALTNESRLVDVGAAGTAMRFLTAFFAQKSHSYCLLTGSERMKQRPIRLLVESLCGLGADIKYAETEGFPPLNIFGKNLEGGTIKLLGNVSSQFISALMMIAPKMKKGLNIELIPPIISEPYITLTQQLMKAFGVSVERIDNLIKIPFQSYQANAFTIESDWSAASYWYEILALRCKGSFFLKGLYQKSAQGDAQVAKLFEKLGIVTQYENDGVRIVAQGSRTEKITYNFVNQPDLVQTFVVTCCFLNVPFHFSGLQSLKIKETNRIVALITELSKFGFDIEEPCDGELQWSGERKNVCSDVVTVSTYDDHRMAMAFAPIAIQQPLVIQNCEVVSKSYPTFWDNLSMANYQFKMV